MLDSVFSDLNEKANVIYKHVWLHNEYDAQPRDYGTGQLFSEVEVHTITAIAEREGITISELAKESNRTKGAISQLISKLEQRGYVTRNKRQGNGKTVHLHLTTEGRKVDIAHRAFDRMQVTYMINQILQECTPEEVNGFYKVIDCRNRIMEARHHRTDK